MRYLHSVCVIFVVGILVNQAPATLVESDFDSDTEGWSIWGDGESFQWKNYGQPLGSIYAEDKEEGEWWGFSASSDYLGDKSDYYGGTFSYDLYVSRQQAGDGEFDVQLVSSSMILTHKISTSPPARQWVHVSINLSAADTNWVKESGDNPAAQEFTDVLGDLTSVQIKGEYHSSSWDFAYLDNVVLIAVPEPATLSLMLLGGVGLVRRRRR